MTESNDIVRPALYYPYIHVRSEEWLKATLLYVPVVKRLVPEGYEPEDEPRITPYVTLKGPYGELLQTVPAYTVAADMAQQELLQKIKGRIDRIKKKYCRSNAPRVDKYWIHDAKFSGLLLRYLEHETLAWKSTDPNASGHRNWYALHPTLGKAVMTCIGLSTARERKLDIVTADGRYHEALLTTNEDEIFDVLLAKPRTRELMPAPQARHDLGQLVIAFAGVNLSALRPERIPELQASKKFSIFRNTLRTSASTIDKGADRAEYERQLRDEAERIVDAWRDAVNDINRDLREAVFEAVALSAETVKTLVKGPEWFEIAVIGGLGLWRLGGRIQQFAEHRGDGHHFLSQIRRAESKVLLLQYPLGL